MHDVLTEEAKQLVVKPPRLIIDVRQAEVCDACSARCPYVQSHLASGHQMQPLQAGKPGSVLPARCRRGARFDVVGRPSNVQEFGF